MNGIGSTIISHFTSLHPEEEYNVIKSIDTNRNNTEETIPCRPASSISSAFFSESGEIVDEVLIEDIMQVRAMTQENWFIDQQRAESKSLDNAILFCQRSHSMVSEILTNKKSLITHGKKESDLFHILTAKDTPRRKAVRELVASWRKLLVYGLVLGKYYNGGTVCHLMNRDYLSPDPDNPGEFVRPERDQLGFFLELKGIMFTSADNAHCWLYNLRCEPWGSPKFTRMYLARLEQLMDALHRRREIAL
ncbi:MULTISPECIES: hypothetical protein [Acidithiobacillus]|uniref:Uncharacterized protein n=3 Tax=Acidithiobacillus TaxID=119977 RepID=A0A179B897_ACIFR|nr:MULTISPECIES: hypothetical protein [Acidithiobacillus]MDA8181694.1 hypothetical protein [Acidithiobacillus sp.]MBU2852965.1 hypothetical protein [Acidithiobacillus ferriphilus]MEB8486041.1 hypothetical protein [Acidithiobacillus ferriphilus]MEB8488964.1 hypothetical protein [Acidithiobacillus ferriphilus]MEB8492395.1 hypothetical protein [Acidithiobacillus ferriphilus]